MIEDTNVTAKEYRKMQKFLLLIAGCIAIDQTLLSIVILLSLLMGLQIACDLAVVADGTADCVEGTR